MIIDMLINKDGKAKHTIEEILLWISGKNEESFVSVERTNLSQSDFWFYDNKEGLITNKNNSFFKVVGLRALEVGVVFHEQPII